MRKRTKAREFAVQFLYQLDITKQDIDSSLADFWQNSEEEISDEVKNFASELIKGTIDNLSALDKKLSQYATNWQLERMAVVDRNILRLGAFELLFRADIPPKVSINEAVDLAKKYSGLEAGKFVNGILDKLKSDKT
ncbi:MAG: transcription antitermination factor NusB [Candidatus Omnitrophica bacterium]|nr:transcription antitermination factor NusB [Candidatus Omnitrophota bacterium]